MLYKYLLQANCKSSQEQTENMKRNSLFLQPSSLLRGDGHKLYKEKAISEDKSILNIFLMIKDDKSSHKRQKGAK